MSRDDALLGKCLENTARIEASLTMYNDALGQLCAWLQKGPKAIGWRTKHRSNKVDGWNRTWSMCRLHHEDWRRLNDVRCNSLTTLRSDNMRIDGAMTMDGSSLCGDGDALNQMLTLAITEKFCVGVVWWCLTYFIVYCNINWWWRHEWVECISVRNSG